MGIPVIKDDHIFPIDTILLEMARLRQLRYALEKAHEQIIHPDAQDIELADIPYQVSSMREWVNREEKLREIAISDFNHGINPTWPPKIVPLALLRRAR